MTIKFNKDKVYFDRQWSGRLTFRCNGKYQYSQQGLRQGVIKKLKLKSLPSDSKYILRFEEYGSTGADICSSYNEIKISHCVFWSYCRWSDK